MTILKKALEHRWELWLFLGLPVAAWLISLLGYEIVEQVHGEGALYGIVNRPDPGWILWYVLLYPMAGLVLLAISYWRVRQLERELLRMTWRFFLLILGIEILRYVVVLASIADNTIQSGGLETPFSLSVGIALFVIQAGLLVWFVRRVSRRGLDKALILIGISAHSYLSISTIASYIFTYRQEYRISQFVILLVGLSLTLVAVWALRRGDTDKTLRHKGIAMLFVAAFLSLILSYSVREGGHWAARPGDAALLATIQVGIYVAVIIAAYVVRVRVPKEDAHGESPPSEEPIDRTTLLYGGSWRDSA